jgi:hypothetical protein
VTTTADVDVAAVQRRSVGTLVASQALGALGIILAFKFGGMPIYVMS